jgi:hypothetical protein
VKWVEALDASDQLRRVRWAPYPADWRKIVDWVKLAAERGDPVGFDTEFYGADLRTESPVGRVHVHVWSLALLGGTVTPRGNRRAMGFTLPEEALHHPHVRGMLEDPDITKVAHNSPVDAHSAGNSGVVLRGLINSLSLGRWMLPARKDGPGFGLKSMMELVGRTPFAEYKTLMAEEWLKETAHTRTRKVCSCGVPKCLKRKGHTKTIEEWVEYTGEIKSREVHLADVVPGHALWDRLRIYAAEDAEAAVELWEKLRLLGRRRTIHNPFFKETDAQVQGDSAVLGA